MEKAWEAAHKPLRSVCIQGGITVGEGHGQPGVILASRCWVCVNTSGGNSALETFHHLCAWYG